MLINLEFNLMSRKAIAETLGLFTLPPPVAKLSRKDKEAKQAESQLLSANRDFFEGPQVEDAVDKATAAL